MYNYYKYPPKTELKNLSQLSVEVIPIRSTNSNNFNGPSGERNENKI